MTALPFRHSQRALRVAPFHAMRMLARARALEADGHDVIHMEIGEPDFPTPAPVIEAARRALDLGRLGYTPAAGLPALREAIAGYYAERYGLVVDPRRIFVTPGGSGALQLVLAALVGGGDSVLMADPGYPCNRHMVLLAGGCPQPVPVGPEDAYQLTAARAVDAWSEQVAAVMVASPSNPTGTLLAPGPMAELHALAAAKGVALVVDEIYQGLVYDGEDHTALALGDEGVFVVNSFSKYFGMTGWRLGWVVAPSAAVDLLDRLAQNLYLAAPTLSQQAALAAFAPGTLEILEQRRQRFQERRGYLVPALESLGLEVPAPPRGAFYVYARIPGGGGDADALCHALLEQAYVAVTPGCDFGDADTGRMLRFAYTTDVERLREAIARIEPMLRRWA